MQVVPFVFAINTYAAATKLTCIIGNYKQAPAIKSKYIIKWDKIVYKNYQECENSRVK